MTQRHVPGRAARVHHSALVIDTHIDTLTHIVARSPDFSTVLSDGRVDIPRLRKGGVGAAYFAVWIDEGTPDTEALKYTLRSIEAMHEAVAVYSSDLEVALTGADITRIHAAGKVAVVITIEGGRVICDDLRVLGALQRLGVRSITLAWGAATTWMDSWNQEKHGGLTGFGRDVVHRDERPGHGHRRVACLRQGLLADPRGLLAAGVCLPLVLPRPDAHDAQYDRRDDRGDGGKGWRGQYQFRRRIPDR